MPRKKREGPPRLPGRPKKFNRTKNFGKFEDDDYNNKKHLPKLFIPPLNRPLLIIMKI